jgi:hypothetical protein
MKGAAAISAAPQSDHLSIQIRFGTGRYPAGVCKAAIASKADGASLNQPFDLCAASRW